MNASQRRYDRTAVDALIATLERERWRNPEELGPLVEKVTTASAEVVAALKAHDQLTLLVAGDVDPEDRDALAKGVIARHLDGATLSDVDRRSAWNSIARLRELADHAREC